MLFWLIQKLSPFVKKYFAHIAVDVAILILILTGVLVVRHLRHDAEMTTTQVTPTVKVITVDKPVITEKIVDKVVPDPKDRATISALLKENDALRLSVTQLTTTIANLQSHGGTGDGGTVDHPDPQTFHFKDWRLDFTSKGNDAQYDLTQQFKIFTTTARGTDGQKASIVKLYEVGPKGELNEVKDVSTTAIFADETHSHWFVKSNIQAGFAVVQDADGTRNTGGLVGLQWLKRGLTNSPEDVRLAVLTPTFFASEQVKEPGVLPLSFNLGSLPHQPFTNIWVSPYLGFNPVTRKMDHIGFALTATF